MLDVHDEPEKLVHEVSDLVETFVTNLKRGRMGRANSNESVSTAAAVEMAELMATIVRLFQGYEEGPHSVTIQMLRANFPALEVASAQVRRLLILIGRTGDALLRSQFATLLLMNVTRRVLSIIRESAALNKATEKELEEEAKVLLNTIGYEDEDEDGDEEEDAESRSDSGRRKSMSGGNSNFERGSLSSPSAAMPSGMRGSRSNRQGLSVRFADNDFATAAAASGMMSMGSIGSPILRRTGSIVASEIPGQQILTRAPSAREDSQEDQLESEFPVHAASFYQDALDGIEEFKAELEGMTDELCRRAPKQLHSFDTVMTLGSSNTTRRYLLQAASEGRTFKVFILEGAPAPQEATQRLASLLTEKGVLVQVLPDSSAFAVMNMCTRVLISAESVLANGGLLAPVGTHMLCVAARHFAVPVLVATTTLKMSPYYPNDQLCTRLVRIALSGAQEMPWSTYGSSEAVLPCLTGSITVEDGGRDFTVHSPVTEYVPPELITLYATNESEYMPSQIHRIVRANYSDVD